MNSSSSNMPKNPNEHVPGSETRLRVIIPFVPSAPGRHCATHTANIHRELHPTEPNELRSKRGIDSCGFTKIVTIILRLDSYNHLPQCRPRALASIIHELHN